MNPGAVRVVWGLGTRPALVWMAGGHEAARRFRKLYDRRRRSTLMRRAVRHVQQLARSLRMRRCVSIAYSQIFTLSSEERTLLIQGYPSGAIHREPDFSGSSVGLCSPTSVARFADQSCPFVSIRFHRSLGSFLVKVVLCFLFVLSVLFGRSCRRICGSYQRIN